MKVSKIFLKIAAQKGISVTEVRNEIQAAINEGMKSTDPKVQEYWKKVPCRGDKPTPEEVVTFVNKEIKRKQYSNPSK